MKHLDLFSGIGGFALAASWVWGEQYENVGHCEIEEYACKVYHRHFPTSKCLGDITKVKWNEGYADIITGGFPCQPHSVAGKRLASDDERDLWGECKRAIGEIRPKYALFENVPGLLTSERGRFFNRVLSDLAEVGYNAEWRIISAKSVGSPQRRKRLWLVASPNEVGRFRATITSQSFAPTKNKFWSKEAFDFVLLSQKQIDIDKSVNERISDGIPNFMDRFATLGNAIVPQVAEVVFQAIKDADEKTG